MAYQETLDEAISLAAVAATSFHASTSAAAAADAQNREATALCDALKQLLEASSRLEVVGHLSSENVALNEFLSLVPFILTSSQADASLRSRLLRVLFQIALYNRPLRRRMCSAKLELCAPVWQALRTSVREQLGPQNMIDILRLLQVLTYERTLQLGVWVNDLISFLLTEIVREQETEWMPFCMAILCNLASRSKTVCTRIRSSSQYKPLARRLLKLLAHDSRMVVISALVLVGFLDDKIRDTVYCKVNVEQTLQCVFNVLILGGNELMTRHVAADLLQRITITPAHASTSLAPELTAIGSDLTTFPYFARSIQKIGALLVTLDPRSEEMLKMYEVLCALCSVASVRSPVCSALATVPPDQDRLGSPVLAMRRHALSEPDVASRASGSALPPPQSALSSASVSQTSDDQIAASCGVPVLAATLLTHVVRESIEQGSRVSDLIPVDYVVQLARCMVRQPVDSRSAHATLHCRRIQLGLQLAEALCADEEARSDVISAVDASLCAHIAQTQLITNPIAAYLAKPPAVRLKDAPPEWSSVGVGVMLALLRLLASLKDFSKPHKSEYWKELKDDRLIPLLAWALARGQREMTELALQAYTHCAQVPEWPTNRLADLLASCTATADLQLETAVRNGHAKGGGGPSQVMSPVNGSAQNNHHLARSASADIDARRETPPTTTTAVDEREVDRLIDQLRRGVQLPSSDGRLSAVVAAYERKLASADAGRTALERLLASKQQALDVAERLRVQQRVSPTGEKELNALKSALVDTERRAAETAAEATALRSERDEFANRNEQLSRLVSDKIALLDKAVLDSSGMRRELNEARGELKKEQELSAKLVLHKDDISKKFDLATRALDERVRECDEMRAQLATDRRKAAEAEETRQRERDVERDRLTAIENRERALQKELADARQQLEQMADEVEKASRMRERMMRLMNDD